MMPKIYAAIEDAVAKGVQPQYIAYVLIREGWPSALVNQAFEAWMEAHGRSIKKTGFKDWLKKYHNRAIPAVIIVVIISLISTAFTLLQPWPLKILADSAFGNIPAPGILEPYTHTSTLILIVAAASIGLFIGRSLFGYIEDFLLLRIGFWLNRSIKAESLNHILHLPLFHQERLAKGDYVYRQNTVTNSLSDLVLATTASIISSIIMIIAILFIMFSFNVKLTIFSIILIPLLFLTMKLIGPIMGKYNQELNEIASSTAAKVTESVDNAETVQAFTLEQKLLNNIDALWHRGYVLTKKSMFWGKILTDGNGLLIVIATSGVMYFGGSAALNGMMSFGDLLVFMTYMGFLLSPVQEVVTQITTRNKKIIDVHRIYEVLSDHEGIENLRADNHMPPQIQGKIDFQNVSYNYKDNQVLNNVNLTINQGEKVGIIGPSGGGKSTMLKLLPLFIEPISGRILIDGMDIQTVSLQELRKHVAWVSQTPQLFDGTIIDNLLDGDIDKHFQTDEVMQAIEVANVSEFAERLPMGLNTPTGENGGSLSGGQRQRVSIARSLLKGAPIICLDEPTAALDAKSENYIKDSLSQMIQGKTVMMVTHRRALLALMDTVYVLDGGVLTNVNDLGGLDYYLAQLEGINMQIAENVDDNMPSADLTAIPDDDASLLVQPETEYVQETPEQQIAETIEAQPEYSEYTENFEPQEIPELAQEQKDNEGTITIDHNK